MTQQLHESLSAIMDGEGNELELRRVLKTLDESPELGDVWRRYHLMRSALRRERDTVVDMDIASSVMAVIEQDETPLGDTAVEAAAPAQPVRSQKRRGLSLMGGAAVAAAVSLMVVSGVQFYRGHDSAALPDAASLQANNAVLDNAAQQLAVNGSDSLGTLGYFGQGNQAMAASYADFAHAAGGDLTPVSWSVSGDEAGAKSHSRRYNGHSEQQDTDSTRFHFERGLNR
ncbi:sigma-E factor negative regulatory protein [Zymobacter palmae]|uniref:Negative regulator of sigmaE activity n=1 Tax=Zymobacter palmae TaxID=33074 RepID=A0A348HGD2_9GAMM|nr:sigma-E factor negative regulatory protein [Zymobacter palmae]BBG30684.1 negative regulator of sigmaE activity [Zymobacter palmae]